MGPHNFGVTGDLNHSHNVEYPDDAWNLYAMLDTSSVALNVVQQSQAIGVFKPHALRLSEDPSAVSDADAEIIFILRFIFEMVSKKSSYLL